MSAHHRLYGWSVRLYPRAFRDEYGDALEQHFADLVADRGARAAWARTSLDLLVTLPRHRLESSMTERHSTTTLAITIGLLAAAGAASFLTGVGPGVLLLVAALALGVSQRSDLARAIRTPVAGLRRRRLTTAAALGATFVSLYVIYLNTIGDSWTVRDTVLALVGTSAMIGSIGFFVVGLLTPAGPALPEQPTPSR